MERLKRLFSRRSTTKPTSGLATLPPDIAKLVASKQAGMFALFIEDELKKDRGSPLIPALQAAVASADWPAVELTKLNARIKFNQRDYRACHRFASNYLDTEQFNVEVFSFACLSLYSSCAYEAALALFTQWSDKLANEDLTPSLINMAIIIHLAGGGTKAAEPWLHRGLERCPDNALFCANSINIFTELGDEKTAERIRQTILAKHRDYPEAMFSLAYDTLSRDDYREGFKRYEARFNMQEVGKYLRSAQLEKTPWDGAAPLQGKRLLVHAEQGLGDSVMLSRYLPLLLEQTNQVVFECQSEAIPLLSPSFPQVKFIPLNMAAPPDTPCDIWVSSMSLPYLFGTTTDKVPATNGYLAVSAEHQLYWNERVAALAPGSRPKIGLAWSGNPAHRADRRRSIPFARMRPYIAGIDADFFALQTTVPDILPMNVINVTDELITLADTAALIQRMDLVVTVDTSIVHIAGALGHPCWLLLPYRYEWRWGLQGQSNSWYDSVQVFRQHAPDAWTPLLDEIFSKRIPEFLVTHKERQ
jgi:hypothetical protein